MPKNTVLQDLDLREFVRLNIKCVYFFGYFWPEFEKFSMKKFFYFLYVVMFVGIAFVLSLMSQIANMIDSFGDMERMTEASFLLFTNIVQCLKLYCFMGYGPRIWKLIHSMNNDIFKPQNLIQTEILLNEIKLSKLITKLFLLACTLTCMSWAMSPLMDPHGNDGNGVRLPLSGWYPYNTKQSPLFELTYIYQIGTTWICGLGDISMDTFVSGMIMFISGQLSILNNALKNMKTTENKEKQKLQNLDLIRNIIHHRNIINFSNEVTFLFTHGITGQFVVGVIIVCMSMFQMSLVSVLSFRFFAMFLYQTCVLMEIYLWCFYGNEVILKSEELTQSAYMSEWTDSSAEFKNNLIIFMIRSQFSIKLYASGYFTLSLETFKAISKSSWSYFAVLNQVHEQKAEY